MKFLSNHYGELNFPAATIEKMKKLNLYEKDIYDVYINGDTRTMPDGAPYMARKYNGYEIGFMYVKRDNKDYTVIAVWKRERR